MHATPELQRIWCILAPSLTSYTAIGRLQVDEQTSDNGVQQVKVQFRKVYSTSTTKMGNTRPGLHFFLDMLYNTLHKKKSFLGLYFCIHAPPRSCHGREPRLGSLFSPMPNVKTE
jgi:hypothetical protein